MIPEPSLYTGTLRHRRFSPRKHEFTYRLFMAWLDIDRIPELMAQSRWTGYDRFNWASFHQRDHFGDPALSLRDRVELDARCHGVPAPHGPIFLLTHLRYLGYCFNPISLYYCYQRDGALSSILAEVNSTFGESHNYWLWTESAIHDAASPEVRSSPRAAPRRGGEGNLKHTAPIGALHFRCPKAMHVSPFLKMELDYEFALTRPGQTLAAHMNTVERSAQAPPIMDATLTLQRQAWTPRNLRRVLMRHPWMTAKVITAIHWQALLLFLKRVPMTEAPRKP